MTTANGDAAATAEDVETVLDALYRGPRERFIAERKVAARRLAAAGRSDDAARVKAASKPSVSAWAVNQLWWAHRPRMQALLDAARRQAHAMLVGAGPAEHAAAGLARRRALDDLLQTAAEVLVGAGHAAGAGTLRKITTTLEALAAHGLHGDGPALGRLCADLDPPGFELMHALRSADLDPVPPAAAAAEAEAEAEDPGRADAEAALAASTERRDAARERARQVARSLDEATTLADDATLAAQAAAQALDQARARAEAARQAAQEAERESLRLEAQARRERQRVEQTRRTLEGLSRQLEPLERAVQRARQRLGEPDDAEPSQGAAPRDQ